jgi:hypothetical protein
LLTDDSNESSLLVDSGVFDCDLDDTGVAPDADGVSNIGIKIIKIGRDLSTYQQQIHLDQNHRTLKNLPLLFS